MSELDHHEAEEVSPRVEEWAEQFRAEMSAELRKVVLENLPDFLDALDPGTAGDDENREAFALALAEFRADLVQNPHAFDRRAATEGLRSPFATLPADAHVVEALALIGIAEQSAPTVEQSRAELFAEAQVHTLLAIARRPRGLGHPGSPW